MGNSRGGCCEAGDGKGVSAAQQLNVAERAERAGSRLMDTKFVTGLRVLVVDDEQPVSDAFKLLLEGDGHAVTAALGGDEALALFRSAQFDLVITDLDMPGIKGDELGALGMMGRPLWKRA